MLTTNYKKTRECRDCGKPLLIKSKRCISCQRAKKKLEREKSLMKKLERKEKKLRTIKGRKQLKKKAEALLHLYIRRRAMDFSGMIECYTCRHRFPLEKIHAGHYRHGKLDLDERNLHPQCVGDNTYKGGLLNKYTLHLIEDYGIEWVKQLDQDADRDNGQYSYEFLQATIEKYTNLLKTL